MFDPFPDFLVIAFTALMLAVGGGFLLGHIFDLLVHTVPEGELLVVSNRLGRRKPTLLFAGTYIKFWPLFRKEKGWMISRYIHGTVKAESQEGVGISSYVSASLEITNTITTEQFFDMNSFLVALRERIIKDAAAEVNTSTVFQLAESEGPSEDNMKVLRKLAAEAGFELKKVTYHNHNLISKKALTDPE